MAAVISFLIIAFVIFVMVKVINSLKTKKDAAVPATPTQEELLTQIRDLLKK